MLPAVGSLLEHLQRLLPGALQRLPPLVDPREVLLPGQKEL
jgi:hypothetical protein